MFAPGGRGGGGTDVGACRKGSGCSQTGDLKGERFRRACICTLAAHEARHTGGWCHRVKARQTDLAAPRLDVTSPSSPPLIVREDVRARGLQDGVRQRKGSIRNVVGRHAELWRDCRSKRGDTSLREYAASTRLEARRMAARTCAWSSSLSQSPKFPQYSGMAVFAMYRCYLLRSISSWLMQAQYYCATARRDARRADSARRTAVWSAVASGDKSAHDATNCREPRPHTHSSLKEEGLGGNGRDDASAAPAPFKSAALLLMTIIVSPQSPPTISPAAPHYCSPPASPAPPLPPPPPPPT